jgi:hypothetical protein
MYWNHLGYKDTHDYAYTKPAQRILNYEGEAWIIRKCNTNTITACKMKLMQRAAGYNKWNHRRNENILDKLKIKPLIYYI